MKDSGTNVAMLKVVIIEDQCMFREFLVKLCRDSLKLMVAGAAGDGVTGLALCRETNPDLLLLDLVLPDLDGFEIARQLLRQGDRPRILALSSECDDFTLHRVHHSGIHGYVDKHSQSFHVLGEAIRSLMAGRSYFTTVVGETRRALRADPLSFTKLFTKREFDMLPLLGEGLSNDEIASRVCLSPSTVQGHRKHIMGKLDFHRTPELIHYCLEKGITKIRPVRSVPGG